MNKTSIGYVPDRYMNANITPIQMEDELVNAFSGTKKNVIPFSVWKWRNSIMV